MTIWTFVMVLGLVLVLLEVFNVPRHPRFNYGWAGVACWMAALLFTRGVG